MACEKATDVSVALRRGFHYCIYSPQAYAGIAGLFDGVFNDQLANVDVYFFIQHAYEGVKRFLPLRKGGQQRRRQISRNDPINRAGRLKALRYRAAVSLQKTSRGFQVDGSNARLNQRRQGNGRDSRSRRIGS